MLYPLRFEPIFRHYLWGGDRLATALGKPVPPGQTCAESWEVVDHGKDQSVVLFGPLRGQTLAELVRSHGVALLGRHAPLPRFPLLFKFLDAEQTLSVQVHPTDEQARRLDPPDYGKTEAWVILAASPTSRIYAGLLPGVDRSRFEWAVKEGRVESTLHSFQPKPGDCVFIPAGTMHALGGGLLVAEIQQSSDTTYRVFDWNRVGPDGQPRPLHIAEALEVTDFATGPVHPIRAATQAADSGEDSCQRLVHCDKFVLEHCRWTEPFQLSKADQFHLLAVLEGELDVEGDASGQPLGRGQSMLIPASCSGTRISPRVETVALVVYLP